MDAEIENDSYETDWEFFEGSITEVVKDIEKT
jgi:hypothetical protein